LVVARAVFTLASPTKATCVALAVAAKARVTHTMETRRVATR
jgi:hypothetical protein